MKISNVDAPELTDAACKAKTGKALKQWFAALDELGGLALGRRELVNQVYEQVAKDAWWSTTIVIEYERSKGQAEKDGKPTGYSICSTKTVEAPIATVYAAFGDAKQLDRWLGPKTQVEFVEGGSFANADGDTGSFKRLRPGKDIRFTWEHAKLAPGSQVEVMFADKGKGKTGITLNHTRIQVRRDADEIRAGWSAALDALKALLEKR